MNSFDKNQLNCIQNESCLAFGEKIFGKEFIYNKNRPAFKNIPMKCIQKKKIKSNKIRVF